MQTAGGTEIIKSEEEGLKSNFVYITNFNWRTKLQKSKHPDRNNLGNKNEIKNQDYKD